jgi:Uma2 family endonuclease
MTAMTATIPKIALKDTQPVWKTATWDEYVVYRNDRTTDRFRLYFYQDKLLVEMGQEGINHANVSDLFTILIAFWFSQHPEQIFNSFGRCLLEKPEKQAGAPDIVLYLGENYPRWQLGDRRYINLDECRVPDLVGEISDTTLASDLDEKKHLYADLGIPEYWVVDVKGRQVIAFILQENGVYKETDTSLALAGLPITLLQETLEHLAEGTNGSAANWFLQQIKKMLL